MKVFKIQDKNTGLFSTGGLRPKWTKTGKVWQRIGHVHSHINQLTSEYSAADLYKNAVIVEAEITEILTPVEQAKDYLVKCYDEEIAHFEDYAKRSGSTYWAKHVNSLKARKALLNG